MNDTSDLSDDFSAIGLLANDFLARYRDGDRPTVDEYARRHPELSSEIHRMLPLVVSVEKVKLDQQTANDGSATLAGRELRRLGDYRIIREIGRGGMGIVFEAEQESLGRRVAIKVLPKQCLLDKEALQQFEREATTAAAMHHSNIVPIFGSGEANGDHYLVMQLVVGDSLDTLMENDNQFSYTDIATLGKQVAGAIHYAHENGVLHRDIKPANILINEDGAAQVTDFGLARNLDDDPTTTRALSGSLRYMAPERFRGESTKLGDVYGLGLTLYEMIAQQPAFVQTDPHQLMDAISQRTPVPLKRLRPDVPIDLETIVTKAIHVEPEHRYQDAASFRDDLQRFLNDEPIKARRTSMFHRCRRWCRRNPGIAAATFITAFALTAATIISTAAYFIASKANQQTVSALENSEQTVSLALQSLDGVVEIASVSPLVSTSGLDGTDEFSIQDLPDRSFEASPYSAQVLERIQPLYERLSQQAPTRPDIVLQTIDASLQLARIQHQRGKTTKAIATLHRAIEFMDTRAEIAKVSSTERQLRMAKLNNQLGTFFSTELMFDEADQSHYKALTAVEQSETMIPSLQLEAARAHLSLGSPNQSQRPKKEGKQREKTDRHIDQATECLEKLRDSDLPSKQIETLYASCMMAKSRLAKVPVLKRSFFDQAIVTLKNQLAETPDDASVRYELVNALSNVNFRQDHAPEHWRIVGDRLQQAMDELKPLRASHPDTTLFTISEVNLWHKLSSVARKRRRFEMADDRLKKAISIQSSLVGAWPDNLQHRCRRALLYRSQATMYRERDRHDDAKQAVQNAQADLDSLSPSLADHPIVKRTQQMISKHVVD